MKRTEQTPAGTLTDTEREALVVAERRGSVRLTVERIVAEREAAAVAAALAPIEAVLDGPIGTRDEDGREDEPGSWIRGARHLRVAVRAALAGGGDRG